MNYSTSSDEEVDGNSDDDNESDKSSDEDIPDVEEDTTNSRKNVSFHLWVKPHQKRKIRQSLGGYLIVTR